MRRYGWTYQQYCEQPWDLVAEDEIEMSKEHFEVPKEPGTKPRGKR